MNGMDERERDLMDERGVTDYIDRGDYKQRSNYYDDDEDYYDDRRGGGRGGRNRTRSKGGGASRTGFSQGGAGMPLEDDAYSVDQKLKQLEGGSYYDDDGYTEEGGYSREEYDSRGGYSREQYSRGYSQEEYASQPQDSRGYSRDEQSAAYTEDRGSYGNSRVGDIRHAGGYSVESPGIQQPAWDEASESQYAY